MEWGRLWLLLGDEGVPGEMQSYFELWALPCHIRGVQLQHNSWSIDTAYDIRWFDDIQMETTGLVSSYVR